MRSPPCTGQFGRRDKNVQVFRRKELRKRKSVSVSVTVDNKRYDKIISAVSQ